ncbi:MAG: M20/M25/M40 family metallo-hydrolase [Solirubrobacterales bacterium]|nr:M20/M25/M40 family metallo-hydrolase [Solirubrobacterales bacterium]
MPPRAGRRGSLVTMRTTLAPWRGGGQGPKALAASAADSLPRVSDERLRDRFARLCEIPSPTGSERAIADAVLAELRDLGVEAHEDGAGGPARAGAGNLIARIPGVGDGWVMLCAHLDTVPEGGPIEVELADGVFRSRGETILGADDKAAVAVLIELAARAVTRPPPVGLELVFTVAEEEGLRGAKELDLSSLRAPYGYALDHATPIGELITAAPTHQRLVAEFEGLEAHAGLRPEDGHSAIAAAAAAIASMKLGRLDPETTANVGLISGGTAANVVAGACRIEGEARSLDEARVSETMAAMLDACTWAASEHGCDLDVEVTEEFRGYRHAPGAAPLRLARSALERCGFEPRDVATGGGSDANALVAGGFECVLLANGTEANHTPAESVAAARLGEMLAVCEAIAELAAAEADG